MQVIASMARLMRSKHVVQLIGIAGGSGSGKTTLAKMLLNHFGSDHASILFQDSYYIDRSHAFKGDGSLNFDHPDAIDWALMEQHLQALRAGNSIEVPSYDFITHKRKPETLILQPKDHVIVDGILLFVHEIIRDLFDIRLFIEASEAARFERRLERDVNERGRTPEGVRIQYQNTVRPMHDLFVEPSKAYAHQIISGENIAEMKIPVLGRRT
jgi:uridine kinase